MFCERCGTKLDRDAARQAHFCAACATFVGDECWVDGEACRNCADAGRASAAVGVRAVRRTHRELVALTREVDGLETIARLSGEARQQLALEAWFVRHRARLVRDAARHAAGRSAPRYAGRLRPLEGEVTATYVEIIDRLDALEAGDAQDARTRRVRVRIPDISPTQQRVVLVAGVVLIGALLAPRLADLGAAPGGSLAGIGVPTSSPEDGVAASRGSPSPAPAPGTADPGTAAPGVPVSMTFDELRMDSVIGDELSIQRGTEEQVSVSAQPTSVDRSLRLVSDAGGIGPVVCMDTAFEVGTVELELLVSDERASVQVMVGDAGALDRFIIEPGRIQFNGTDAPAAIEAGQWYRAGIEREDSFGLASAFVASADGNGHDRFTARAPALTAGDGSAICFGLADVDPGIELLINNVEVRQ